ncbi:MAG: leucine-rich repeat domain-containing protein, partial [Prevotella sp.]|nr:leucine-rich repeat domain-containing protein [Prevotella sp.]
MKKNCSLPLLILLLCMIGVNVSAHDIEVPNVDGVTIYYNYINNGTELAVIYAGDWYGYVNNEYSGVVVIPEEVTLEEHTLKVTSIGEWTFYGCSGLKSITIPPSITHIGNNAFFNCHDLNAVHISNLEAWCNIQFDGGFFSRYHLYLNGKEVKDLVIPESVTSISNYAFAKCYRLLSITIPDGVTNIGYHAFALCSNLQNIYCYSEQVPETGDNVFEDSNYDATLHVPAASVSAYQATEPWKNFKKIVALPAQYDYHPFVEDSKVWVVKTISNRLPTEEQIEYYYFDGDTIVNGQYAKRMLGDRISYGEYISGEYIGAWYEQDKKVYFAFKGKEQFELLYDFTLSTGDYIQSTNVEEGPLQVTKTSGGIPGFNGTYYDLKSKNNDRVERWFEGVGSEHYPWLRRNIDEGPIILLKCGVGDEILYYNSEEDDPYTLGARRHRFDFTHTIKTKPQSRTRNGAEETMYGEYNDQQLCINLDPIDDTYLVSITSESGKTVYEKEINAGNIVALNIDISTYAEGRYTVTVENSRESFTGEFGAQT